MAYDTTSLASLYAEYVVAYFDFRWSHNAHVTSGIDGEGPGLFFLRYGGVGLVQDRRGIPIWAPNYPSISEERIARLFLLEVGRADMGVFPETTEHSRADMATLSLHTTGVYVDTVQSATQLPSHESMISIRTLGERLHEEEIVGITKEIEPDLGRSYYEFTSGSAWLP